MAVTDRRAVLDATHAQIVATPRVPHPEEPPAALNAAYTDLLFACGYARLGATDRARELQGAAAALPDEPVHAYLAAAFDAALGGRALPSRDALDRAGRYGVERFLEVARLICDEPIDAMRNFGNTTMPVDPEAEAEAARVAEAYVASVMLEAGEAELLAAMLGQVLSPNPWMPFAQAAARLEIAIGRLDELALDDRGALYARAALYATHAAPHRAVALARDAARLIEPLSAFRRREAMEDLAAALARHPPLGAVWPALPPIAEAEHAYLVGAIRLGDPRGLARWWSTDGVTGALERDALLGVFFARPYEARFAEPWVATLYRRTTDNFGTNSYYTRALVELVDRAVRAIVDDE